MLQHWDVRQPVGLRKFGIGSVFLQTEYPFLRYNIFYYVYVLSFYQKARENERFKEARDILSGKLQDGKMIPGNPPRAWNEFDFARNKQISIPATERRMEIEANMKTGEF